MGIVALKAVPYGCRKYYGLAGLVGEGNIALIINRISVGCSTCYLAAADIVQILVS